MFIQATGGYNRHGEQSARGRFLLVFSHNQFKMAEEQGVSWQELKYDSRKLYACARLVTLTQFGHFMMGTARIAGQSVTVSGTYGNDGLPMDYEKLSANARTKLIEVPRELADQFWQGGGHNTSGSEGPAMRKWAIETFKRL